MNGAALPTADAVGPQTAAAVMEGASACLEGGVSTEGSAAAVVLAVAVAAGLEAG